MTDHTQPEAVVPQAAVEACKPSSLGDKILRRILELGAPAIIEAKRARWEAEVRERLLKRLRAARQGAINADAANINAGDLLPSDPAARENLLVDGKGVAVIALDDVNEAVDYVLPEDDAAIFEKGEQGG